MIRCADAEGIDLRIIYQFAKISCGLRLVSLDLRDSLQRIRQPARVDLGDGYDVNIRVVGKNAVQLPRTASRTDHTYTHSLAGRCLGGLATLGENKRKSHCPGGG